MTSYSEPTVKVEPLDGSSAYRMTWLHQIDPRDVHTAFAELNKALKNATTPIDVIVDLQANPRFPLATTLMECLNGPFRHARLGEWIVISANHEVRTIGRTLSAIARRSNIRWFTTEADALSYLNSKQRLDSLNP
jgi:hypothetical protein